MIYVLLVVVVFQPKSVDIYLIFPLIHVMVLFTSASERCF